MSEYQTKPDNDPKKSFGRDVGKLVSGTIIAQLAAVCFYPVITRIFNPELLGVASVFFSIASIITAVSCLRYELAIILPKDDRDAGAIFFACLLVLLCVSLICTLVFFLFGDLIAELLGSATLKGYLFLIPIAVFIDGLYFTLRYWNTRRKRFGTQAITQTLQSVSGSGLKLSFGVTGFVTSGSLIVGQVIGNCFGMLILLVYVIKYDFTLIRSSFSWKNIHAQMVRYKKFPMYNIWGATLNSMSGNIPVFILTVFFSSTVTGLYTLGMYVIQTPMNFIGSSISQVFLQRAAIAKHNNTLSDLARDTCSILVIIAVLPFSLLSILGGDIFGIVFGPEWGEAGVYVQIIGLWAMVQFITSPLTTIAIVIEKQEINLVYNIILLVTRVAALLIGGIFGSVYLALILFMISGVAVYGGIGYLCVVVWAKASVKEIWKQVKQPMVISFVLVLFVLIISYVMISSVLLCALSLLVGIVYALYIFKTQPLVRAYFGR